MAKPRRTHFSSDFILFLPAFLVYLLENNFAKENVINSHKKNPFTRKEERQRMFDFNKVQ